MKTLGAPKLRRMNAPYFYPVANPSLISPKGVLRSKFLRCVFAFCALVAQSVHQDLTAQQTEIFINPIRHYRLGLEYFDKEKFSMAQKQFVRAIEEAENPNSEVAVNSEYFAALCAIQLFHRDAALSLRDFIRKYPESPKVEEAYFQLGIYHYRKREWSRSLEWLEKVDPYDLKKEDMYEFRFKRGYAYLKQDEIEKASRDFYEIKDVDNAYSSPARYYSAHIAYLKKNYETALTDFRKLEDHDKFGPIVPYYISQILYNQKKYDELLEYAPPLMEKVVSKRKAEMSKLIGEAYFYKGMFTEALPYFEEYHKLSQQINNDDRYQLGYTYYKLERYEEASKLFSRLTELKNEMAQIASYQLADCFIKMDQKIYARSAFKNAYDLGFDEDINENSLFNYARLSYELNLNPYQSSIEAFQEFIDKFPESEKIDEAYEYLIAVYLTTNNYDAALQAIEKVKIKSPNLKAAYQKIAYNKAIALYQNRSYQEAITYFDRSHKYQSDAKLSAMAFYWKGESRFRLREYENAIEDYNAFLYSPSAVLTEVFNECNYNLGYCYFKKESYEEANKWYRKFIYNPELVDTFKLNDAYLRIGDCFFVLKSYTQAIDFYGRAIALNQFDQDYALFQSAICSGIQKDFPQKSAQLEKLVASSPGSSYLDAAYYELGRTYNIQGKNAKALASFNTVIDAAPKNIYLKKSLNSSGLIYYNQGENDKAVSVFTRIVKEYPTYEDTKEALVVLKNIYLERGDVDTYTDLVSGLSFVDVSRNELDSAVFDVAELKYFENECEVAIPQLKKYLEKFTPGMFTPKANFYLADCHWRLEQYDSAVVYYEALATMSSNQYKEDALLKAAEHWFQKGEYTRSLGHYENLELEATSAPMLRAAVSGQQNCAVKMDTLFMAFDKATKYLGHGFSDPDFVVMAHSVMAKKAMRDGDIDSALALFQFVSDTTDSEFGAEATYYMAEINFNRDSTNRAEDLVFELVNQTPTYGYWVAKGLILLSDVYLSRKDYFQAKAALKGVLENYDGKDLKKVAQNKYDNIIALENPAPVYVPDTSNVEIRFDNLEINYEEIDALFDEEQIEDEVTLPLETPKTENDGPK